MEAATPDALADQAGAGRLVAIVGGEIDGPLAERLAAGGVAVERLAPAPVA